MTAAIAAALRARAADLYPDEAGTELLISHGGLVDLADGETVVPVVDQGSKTRQVPLQY